MFQVTQRLFPLCGQSSARIVQSSSSRVMSLTLGSASSTILSENTCLRDNFHHGRTIVPSVRFSTWRYYNYSPLNYFTTTALPITPFYRAPRFVTLVGDMNNNLNHAQQHEQTRGFATKKVSRMGVCVQRQRLCLMITIIPSHTYMTPLPSLNYTPLYSINASLNNQRDFGVGPKIVSE